MHQEKPSQSDADHIEKRRAQARARYHQNREQICAARARRHLSPEQVERLRERDRATYWRNRERILAAKPWRREQLSPEQRGRRRATDRAYYAKHKITITARQRGRRAHKSEDQRCHDQAFARQYEAHLKERLAHGPQWPLLGGPYGAPEVDIGATLTCRLRGPQQVKAWSEGRIPWPLTGTGRRGAKLTYVLCGDLRRALETEHYLAVAYWWGVSHSTVIKWRRALRVHQP